MNKILFYRPEAIAFFSGACVMIFEILGARVLGPYIGTSLFVWTSLIAIILGALALGYYYGGKIADKKSDLQILSAILLLSSISISLLILVKSPILHFISTNIHDIRVSSIIISIILFTPTSILLGMLQPIVTKLRLIQIDTSGAVVGKIGSIGTVGSIIGTLAAGFFLIPFFGVNNLLILLSLSCLLLSIYCDIKKYLVLQVIASIGIMILYLGNNFFNEVLASKNYFIYDTAYSHVQVSDRVDTHSQEKIRDLKIDNITHAGKYVENNDLLYPYTRYYHLFDALLPESKDILMLGGAAYSFPKSFIDVYPTKTLDVVEIDEKITEIAKQHFDLQESQNLNIYHQDARVFLNTIDKKYDAILGDAFGSYYSIPYQLTTLQVAQKKYDLLSENGIVILNVISSLEGEKAKFLQAEYKTYQQVFPEVFVIPVRDAGDVNGSQNIMLIAAKNPDILQRNTQNPELQSYLDNIMYLSLPENTEILTDDYAPVDYYISGLSK